MIQGDRRVIELPLVGSRFSTGLALLSLLLALALSVSFLLVGGNWLVTGEAVCVLVALLVTLPFFLKAAGPRSFPFVAIFAIHILVTLAPRVLTLLFSPGEINYLHLDPRGPDLERTMWFVAISSTAGMIGLTLGGRLASSPPRRLMGLSHRSIRLFLAFAVVSLFMRFLGIFVFGTRTHGGAEFPWGVGYLYLIFDDDVVMILVAAFAVYAWRRLDRVERILTVAYLAGSCTLSMVSGSRSSVIRLALGGLFMMLILHRDFRLSRRMVMVGAVAALLTILFFPLATLSRTAWNVAPSEVSPQMAFEAARTLFTAREGLFRPDDLSDMVLGRAGSNVDVILPLVSEKVPGASEVMSLGNELRHLGNRLLPGDPFGETFSTGRLYNLVFRGYSYEFIEENYQSTVLSVWGVAYLRGGFVGGVAFLMGTMALVPVLFWGLARRLRYPLWPVFLFMQFHKFLFLMGFGWWFQVIVWQAIPVAVASLVLHPRRLSWHGPTAELRASPGVRTAPSSR